jgi:hypothetical protein
MNSYLAHYVSTVNFTAEQNALPAGLDVLGGKAAAVAEATLEKPCPTLEVSGSPFPGTEGLYEFTNKTGGRAAWYQKNRSVGTNWIYYIQNTSRWAIGDTLGSLDAGLYVPSTDPSPDFAVSSWMAHSGTQTKSAPLLKVECATHYHWECVACPKGKFSYAGSASCSEFKAGIAKTPATPWKLGQAWTGSYRLLSGGPVEGNMGPYDGREAQLNLFVNGVHNSTNSGITNVTVIVSWNEPTLGCTGQYVASGVYKYDASDLHSFNIRFTTDDVYYDANTDPNRTMCLGASPIANMTLAGRISEDSYDFQGIIPAPTAHMKGAPSSIYASCNDAQKYNEGTECMDEKTHKFVPSDTKGAICLNRSKTPAPPTDLNRTCSDCTSDPKFAYIGMFHISRNPIRAKQLVPSGNIPLQTPSCSGPSLLLGDTCEFGALTTPTRQQAAAAAARPEAAPTTTVPGSSGRLLGVPTVVVGCIAVALAVVGAVAVFRRRRRRRQVLDAVSGVSVSTNEDADGQAPGRYSAL